MERQEVRWNKDPVIRYAQCAELHPGATVRFRQLAPVEDDNVPEIPVGNAPTYDDLIAHLRRNHWNEQDAVYRWVIGDNTQPQWAVGTIVFAAEDPILQFFAFDHLPAPLQEVAMGFHQFAKQLVRGLPRNAERAVALRKLLEAKDAAVRARIAK